MYIFAVVFTILFKELDVNNDLDETSGYFSRLDRTFFSLVQFMTMDWAQSCHEIREYITWAPLLYMTYLAISSFIVLNLIIAVLCAVPDTWNEKKEEEEEEQEENTQRMKRLDKMSKEIDILKHEMTKTNALLEKAVEEIAAQKVHKRRGLFKI